MERSYWRLALASFDPTFPLMKTAPSPWPRHRRARLAVFSLLLTSVLVSGCGEISDRFKDRETRISQALPPSIELTAFAGAAGKAAEPIVGRRSFIEAELAAFKTRRALECAKGVNPSWKDSTADLRSQLKDSACFAKLEAELLVWLRRMHVGTHLLLPSSPVDAKSLSASILFDQRTRVHLAEGGSLALVSHDRGWELVDLSSGNKLRQAVYSNGVPKAVPPTLSANGRVALAWPSQGRPTLEELESGRVLEDVGATGATGFRWLGPTMAIVSMESGRKAILVDYKTGHTAELPRDGAWTYGGGISTADPQEYLLFGEQHARLVRIDSTPSRMTVTGLRDIPLRGAFLLSERSAKSSDGRYLLAYALPEVILIDLQTAQTISLGPWPGHLFRLAPHGDPNKFFVSGMINDVRSATYVLDLRDRSVARVAEAAESAPEWTYWPAAGRYVVAGNGGLRVVEAPPSTEAPVALDELVARAQIAENERKLAAAANALQDPRALAEPKPVRPQLAVPSGARVLAVGAYESKSGMHGVGRPRVAGAIDVTVRRTSYPVVLVLSSYEPVNWRLQLMPGAQLSGVLLFGYHDSVVVGQGDAKFHRAGRMYAHERSSQEFVQLNREVERLTGLEISNFQGAYSANSFAVGAW